MSDREEDLEQRMLDLISSGQIVPRPLVRVGDIVQVHNDLGLVPTTMWRGMIGIVVAVPSIKEWVLRDIGKYEQDGKIHPIDIQFSDGPSAVVTQMVFEGEYTIVGHIAERPRVMDKAYQEVIFP